MFRYGARYYWTLGRNGIMQLTYFAADGNYGDATGMVIIDTRFWTDEDFAELDGSADGDRPREALTHNAFKAYSRGYVDGKQDARL
jgi:hypothetical protein